MTQAGRAQFTTAFPLVTAKEPLLRYIWTMQNAHPDRPPLSLFQVLACGAAIVTLSMGIRHGFGLWLQPLTQGHDWTRETYALAMAIQTCPGGCSVSLWAWWPTGSVRFGC